MVTVTAFAHANLVVEDVAAARRFYGELLGLEEIHRPEGAGRDGVWYRIGAVELHISYEANPANARSTRHVALEVADLAAARQALEQAGHPIEAARPLPGIERFFTRDPDGNRVELMRRLT
ncbi:MAG: glyoxalase [Herpetosiphonaceae bacterium]|nr:MAG: glyoxalase [Herpetosiphonaceae bacterium]